MPEWFGAVDSPNVRARFVTENYVDAAASRAEGKEVLGKRVLCLIQPLGSTDIAPRKCVGPEGEALINRFPEAWAAFQGEEIEEVDGYPMADLPAVSPERAALLRSSGILTVEQMATVDESVLIRLGFGARDLQKASQDFLVAREAEQKAAEKPKRRGRPPKVAAESVAE